MKPMSPRFPALALFCSLAALSAATARATLITTDPGTGTTTIFTTTGLHFASAFTTDGHSWVTSADGVYGGGVGFSFGFAENGIWTQSYVGLNSSTGSLTVDLGGPAREVGGFINYISGGPGNPTPAKITALGADGVTVLETWVLDTKAPIVTTGPPENPLLVNAGAFRGIGRSQGDIYFLRLENSYIAIGSLQVTPVPEPASSGLVAAAGALSLFARRRKA